ncbi:unnamed protein product [Allacma fusca]|uniref:Uncharacterized protein n=1 Tax=Allacma fusca TaxID=39272 RepID=A0A8J2P9Z2_9HEXA|nr:unnamed protein product [Allacma fusca]
MLGTPVLHALIFLILPSGPNFIYYNVPDSMKNFLTYLRCGVLEGYVVTLWMSMRFLVVGTNMLTFHVILAEMAAGMKAIGESTSKKRSKEFRQQTLDQELKRCQVVQLRLKIFNETNRNLQCLHNIWYFKESILLGYFGIRITLEDLLLGGSFLGLSIFASAVSTYLRTSPPSASLTKSRNTSRVLKSWRVSVKMKQSWQCQL